MNKPTIVSQGLDHYCEIGEPNWTEADAIKALLFSVLSSLGHFGLVLYRRQKTESIKTMAELAAFLKNEQQEHPSGPSHGDHPGHRYRPFNIVTDGDYMRVSYRSHSDGNPHTDAVLENTRPLKLVISGERKASVLRRANAALRLTPPPSLARKVEQAQEIA